MARMKDLMLVTGTPVESHPDLGLLVKREDLACRPPGPQFSKTRGVFAHIERIARENPKVHTFGALDTYHSQAGHAVARACQILGLRCVTFFPVYKHEPGHRPPQDRAAALGAELVGLTAGMSAVLYNTAKKQLRDTYGDRGYMMPNALKLDESVAETAAEVGPDCLGVDTVIVPVSSATIAAGVIRGFLQAGRKPRFILHMGYTRSHEGLLEYVRTKVGGKHDNVQVQLVDEGYEYKQQAREGDTPPFPCSPYYDLKAFRWWQRSGRAKFGNKTKGKVLLWNIG